MLREVCWVCDTDEGFFVVPDTQVRVRPLPTHEGACDTPEYADLLNAITRVLPDGVEVLRIIPMMQVC